MRIAIEGAGEVLRRALSDLVAAAGHEVVLRDADLRILAGATDGTQVPARATLRLGPDAGERAAADPGTALRRALREGGAVAWADPFDPALLLDVLRADGPGPGAEPPEPSAPAAFDAAHGPWLGVDAARRRVTWANPAARRLLPTSDPRSHDLAPVDVGRLLDLVEAPEGRGSLDAGGRRWRASWWTDAAGARVVGLVDASAESPPHDRGLAGLEQMTATLAHELRNPVAAFAGAIDLLSQDLPPSERREVVGLARGRLDQMRLLLDDTLRLARPFKGPPGPVECALVLRSAVAGVRTDPLFAEVDLRVEIEDESILVLGYEQPLRQAVTNLLVNAAQAQAGRGSVAASLRRDGARAVLRVADEGPGVAPALREKVFEPFWTTKKSGTGLGLAYVRRVAEACGGAARVDSAPACGAAFLLELRLVPPPPSA